MYMFFQCVWQVKMFSVLDKYSMYFIFYEILKEISICKEGLALAYNYK